MKRPYTWLDLEHADFLLSSFYFDHGSAHCRACGVGVSWFAWAQHIHGKVKGKETKHQANISPSQYTSRSIRRKPQLPKCCKVIDQILK